jgi:hypothetical protein
LVKFDFETDLRFFASLADLGPHASIEIFESLDARSAQQYSGTEFVERFGWQPLALPSTDTFPGGNELHRSLIKSSSDMLYEIIGYTHENVVIICAVARES